jgi:hypothetical protein
MQQSEQTEPTLIEEKTPSKIGQWFRKPVTGKTFVIGLAAVTLFSAVASSDADTTPQRGPAGPQGEQGPQGEKGDAGERGERRPRGKSAKAPAAAPMSPSSSTTPGGSSIEEGTWEVGKDIRPGTYKASGGSGCYWAILNGPPTGDHDNIEDNGGFTKHVVVTLSEGQWFETNGCGTWTGR